MDFVSSPFSGIASPFDATSDKEMELQALNLYPPLDPPSREDWERFKATIVDHYVGMNMPVKQLVHQMEVMYSFKATYVPTHICQLQVC